MSAPLDTAKVARILALRDKGLTTRQVADAVGCAYDTAYTYLKRAGGGKLPKRTPWTDAEDAELARLRRDSKEWAEIGLAIGRSADACRVRHGIVGDVQPRGAEEAPKADCDPYQAWLMARIGAKNRRVVL